MSKEELVYRIEEKVANAEITNREELCEYLNDLKNKGILTKGQANANMEELTHFFWGSVSSMNDVKTSGKKNVGVRTPKTMEYAYSNVSAGFSSTGMLMLIAIAVPVLVATVCLLNK